MSVICERLSWHPVSRAASRRGTKGWETSKEAVQIDQTGGAGAMEIGRGNKYQICARESSSCLSRRKLEQHVNGWVIGKLIAEFKGSMKPDTYSAPPTLLST